MDSTRRSAAPLSRRACLVAAPVLLAGLLGASGVRGDSAAPAPPPAPDHFILHSENVDRDFIIEVTPPVLPVPGDAKLPVIYALDAGQGIAAPEARALQASGAMAPAFVVAIGYPTAPPNVIGTWRETDLLFRTHDEHGVSKGGGGAAFEAFVLDELRSRIEGDYPVDPTRSFLIGHSLAGLFTADVLVERPEAFQGYLIASPPIWDDPLILAGARAASSQGQGRSAFIAAGGAESDRMLRGAARLAATLSAAPSTFVVRKQVYAGEGHGAYYRPFVQDAFPWVLPGAGRQPNADRGVTAG